MKKFVLIALIAIAALAYFQYVPSKKAPQKEGYVSDMINIKESAQENINEAIEKENNKINEALMENQDLEFAAKYDRAVIKTTLGDIEVKFYGDESPQTVDNFLRLADEKFYDGIAFHRVIKGFMIQGGDPLSKAEDWTNVPVGTGGPGYTLPAEIQLKNERGTIATARQGDQVNPQRQSSGSQFYINTVNNTSLDGGYTVFGKVINGMEIVDKIENIKTNPMEQPLEKIRIDSIELIEKQ